MIRQKMVLPLAALALVVSAGTGFVAVANADTSSTTTGTAMGNHQKPAAVGTVSTISGSTITLTGIGKKDASTTYTVDASSAAIQKIGKPTTRGQKPTPTTISVSDIAVGDTLMVEGTANGTTVAATNIIDGVFRGGPGGPGMRAPGVRGTVSSIDGSSIVVAGKDGKSYTVDASGAAVGKVQTISVSDIQVGDSVDISGAVNSTSVTAQHIMDGVPEDGSDGK